MTITTEEILQMKNKLVAAKSEVERLHWNRQERIKQLNDEGFQDIETADKFYRELVEERKKLEEQIDLGVKELREKWKL